jgi:hypothetical protein
MKKISLLLAGAFILLVSDAQNKDSIPDPEFINQVYHYNKQEKKLSPLEKTESEMKSKVKVMGVGGMKQLYTIDGSRSDIRLSADDVYFVISMGGGMMMDPSSMINLHKFESKKKSREATIADVGYMGGNKQKDDGSISLNFKKLRDGVFAIIPSKKLEKGEYAFINKMDMSGGGMSMKMGAFAFAID